MADESELVSRVDFLMVPTRDFEKASHFYGTVLGLPQSTRYPRFDGAEYETGNLTLSVVNSEQMGLGFERNPNAIALRVDDVAAARAELESRGVEFQGEILDTGVCHMAFFADPDGNALMLHRRYAPPAA